MRCELALELGAVGMGMLWLPLSPPLSAWDSGTVLAADPALQPQGSPSIPRCPDTPVPWHLS